MPKKNKNLPLMLFFFFTLYAVLLIVKTEFFANRVPEWDEAHHLTMGYYFYQAFFTHGLERLRELLISSQQIYPPLYHILIAIGYLIFGVSPEIGIYANIPFVLLLMLSTYGLGKIVGGKKAGFWAAVLTPLLPIFLNLSESVFIDYASISLFVTSFYLLFKADKFTNRKYSILFGISLLLNLLTKWPFVVPALPFLGYVFFSIYSTGRERAKKILNIAIIFAICIPGLLWYGFNYPYIQKTLNFFWDPVGFPQILWANPVRGSWQNVLLYLYTYPAGNLGIGLTILICFFISLFFLKRKFKYLNYLLASIATTYVVLTFLNDKAPKYLAYVYPLMVIIALSAFYSIKRELFKNVFIGFMVLGVLGNLIFTHLNYPRAGGFKILDIPLLPGYETKFVADGWPTEKIVDRYVNKKNCENGVLVLPDHQFLNFPTIKYYLLIKDRNVPAFPLYSLADPSKLKMPKLEVINRYDCIITKTGKLGWFANGLVLKQIKEYLDSGFAYKPVSFKAPDESLILLYIKI